MNENWIGVDFDGTLAYHDRWRGNMHFGEPIQVMVERVKTWLANGCRIKIFTARANDGPQVVLLIQDWLEANGLPRLEVTATKDYAMIELWDDKCIAVERNTGRMRDV